MGNLETRGNIGRRSKEVDECNNNGMNAAPKLTFLYLNFVCNK